MPKPMTADELEGIKRRVAASYRMYGCVPKCLCHDILTLLAEVDRLRGEKETNYRAPIDGQPEAGT